MSSLVQLYEKLVQALSNDSKNTSDIEEILADIKDVTLKLPPFASSAIYSSTLIRKLSLILNYGGYAKECLIQIIFGCDHFFDDVLIEQKLIAYEVISLLTKMLDPLDFERLPKIYAFVVEKLKNCVERLLSDKACKKNHFEVLFVSFLASLKPLLAAKNSLVVMSGLSPPLFEFLFEQLPICNRSFASRYPLAHLSLLKIAKYFSEVNGFFSSASNLRKTTPSYSPSDGLFTIPEARHSKCLTVIFSTLSMLLHNGTVLSNDTIETILLWSQAIPNSLGDAFASILEKPQLLTFRTELFFFAFAGIKKPLSVRRLLESVTQKYFVIGIIPQLNDTTNNMFWRKLLSFMGTVSEAEYKRIFYVLRSSALVRPLLQNSLADMSEKRQTTLKESSFGHREFILLSNFMINLEPPLTNGRHETCLKAIDLILNNTESSKMFGNDFDGWRNAVAYLALYCIENKMKTYYGKPLETFIAFDNGIRSLMNASNTSKVPDGLEYLMFPAYVDSEEESFNRLKLFPSEDFLRANCYLSFVDSLEKFMSFAERGSILDIASISESSRQFFITNLSSCQGWITRISLPLLQVCYKAGRYAQVVRFATFICHVQQQKSEIAKKALKLDDTSYLILYWLVKALVQLSAPQAIYGVHTYTTTVFATDLEFIWPAISAAGGQFEDALNKIELMLAFDSLHEIARNFLQELRIFIFNKIRMPSIFLKSSKLSPPPSEGNTLAWNEWKRCAKFLGEGQSVKDMEEKPKPDARIHSLPWEIEYRLMDFEQKLMDIQQKLDVFSQHKKNRHQRSEYLNVIENELKELGNQINQYLYALNMVDIPSKFHSKFAILETIRKLISGKLLFENHKNGSIHFKKELDLIELNQSLLDKWRINTVDRLSIGQQIGSWIDKLNYYDYEKVYESHLTLTKLACKTGNLQMAKHHLHQMEEIKKAEQAMEVYSNYSQNPYGMMNGSPIFNPQSFNQLPGYPIAPGFAVVSPVMPSSLQMSPNNLSISLPLEMIVQAAKIARLSKINKDDGTAFFTLGNAISIQDVAMCSPSISPAPGMQRENPEFLFQIEKVRRAVLKLGNWATEVSNGYQRICETNKYQPNPLWDMILKRFNILGNVCGDTTAEKTLEGSLYWLATEIGSNLTTQQVYFAKAHRKLAEWSLEQLYKDEDCILNLTGTEIMGLQTFGITTDHVKYKEFQKLLTLSTNFIAFKKEAISLLKNVSISAFESLSFERLWNQIKHRQATLFDITLKGYLHFLAQSGSESQRSIHTVTPTLHILKMLVTHPDLFELTTRGRWLADTNENIWKDIIPQLFARLNHPDLKVRTAICDLLKKISVTSPHAICFPAIVGAYFSRSILVPSEAENDHTIGENEDVEMTDGFGISGNVKQDRTQMSAACLGIVEALQQQYPQLVSDVTTFIRELQRINMLNEEKWMFVLNNLDMEMTKRIRQLEIEDQRTFASKHLSVDERIDISRKRSELFTGIICQILEDFCNSTFKTEGTDVSLNEASFREEFERDISAALKHFIEHRIKDPKQAWSPFKKLATVFNHRASKKSSLSLNIHDLSPFLATMRNSAIPMPGQELQDGNIITIASMKEQVTIMVTKTRPKKITFIGSDGKEYVFLFKGHEDLHLDERVMQLLHICNLMLSDKKHISAEDAWPPYICKNYSVTPIGIRSGLIRWVSGATSMFQIYRKWKSRQNNRDTKKTEKQENAERPMDIFFKHLKSAFQANNIPLEIQQDRKQWPVPILRQVLEQLIAATPRDILSRELWMAAGNSETWWKVTQRFSRSTAVASMVGAVIGLGDRHMENLLINLSSGDVIHIDYNVCFDKGRHLRVPETVPFRLTGNIVNALGPTQIEGTFRQSCEHVMGVLRTGKETLSCLFDAFVYDPLVDWAMQDQMASATVNVSTILAVYGNGECNISNNQFNLSLFKLRIQEFQVLWLNSAKLLEDSIQKLLFVLQQLKKTNNVIETAELNAKLSELTTGLHNAIRKHYNIASYFRPLIKSLSSSDDSFCNYAQQYSENLSDSLARGFKLLNESDFNVENCYEALKSVAEHVYEVHNGLIKLGEINQLKLTSNNLCTTFEDLQVNEENPMPRHLREDENAHAKMISKRIRRRLDGCEYLQTIDSSTVMDSTKSTRRQGVDALPMCYEGPEMTTTEQVNMLIDSATNLDNLCLLYEGWTAWV
uniref:non-specific serine/threonine protein kinase n=1 Tax=Panagrolaimus superbus TaxID=310955 RepID=A0A914Z0Q0_9BILA